MKNYRPISQLPFCFEKFRKVVLQQLPAFSNENSIVEMFQSGFKIAHSTESTLLKVFNDILALDEGDFISSKICSEI